MSHSKAREIAMQMLQRHNWCMDLKHLRSFVAVVEEGSVLRGAQRLNMAQPALSRRIQDLEAELGCALLKRGPRGVSTTPAGLALYRDALSLIDDLNGIVQNTRRLGLDQDREIRLGLAPSASRKYAFIEKALERSQENAAIAFVPGASTDLVSHLRGGQCDLALLFEQVPASSRITSKLIHSEHYILATYHSHSLAQAGPVDLADISGQGLVWLSRRDLAEASNPLMQQLRLRGIEPVISHLTTDTGSQLDLVAAGAGICLTPASTMQIVPEHQFCFRPIRDFNMLLEFRLAWQAAPDSRHVARLLADFETEIAEHRAGIVAGEATWTRLYGHSLVELPPEVSPADA